MDGQSFSREVAFSQSVINIGADQGNDIVLRGNSVADFHVLMHYDSGRWSISPLNGAYRTTINGRSLDVEGAVLQNGSIVEIGTYRLTMMLNGVNTDIIIQSQSGTDTASMDSDSIGSDQNIQIEITKMDRTELDAGSAAEIELTVTNAGPLVANMQLQLQGIPSTWVQIIPPVLNLNEGRKGTFLVRISPPRNSSAEAGLYSLHFVAISPNYPRNTGIADTSLTILPYSEFLISGPTPMQLKLSHGKPTDIANFVIINNSNSVGSYFVQSRDDSNELNFAYQKTGSGALAAGQEMVTVRPGDSIQIPMEVTAKKIPLLGVSSKHHHYYTNVTPSDRPGDAQTIAGEVMIKPAINTMLLLLLLAVLIIVVGFIFQPYIHQFECQEGRRSQVIVAGNAAQLSWNVSGFASAITLNNGQTDTEVSNSGTQYVSPTVSTTYTLTAENFISSLLHITHKKTVQVLVVPSRPAIDVFSVDKGKALYDETVTLNWSVEPNATAASITSNKSTTQLAAENYTGKLAQGYQSDTLISLKAQNDSGYDLKSLFINVASDSITLKKFTVWVRPNGIAIPEDNDVRRTTRWGALELTGGTEQPVRSGASGVNPQPAAQSNTLEIPDDYNSTGAGTQLLNPEVMAAAGQPMPSTGTYSYQPPAAGSGSAPSELLVSPSLNAAAVPTAADPTAYAGDPVIVRPAVVPTASVPSVSAVSDSVVVRSTAVPAASPEGSSPNRDFSIKLAEVIEDPLADSGYRVISYYPNYVLQKQEQILVEWSVDGVSKVKIENLSGDDLQNVGSEYAYPEKSTTYTLTAQVGETKKAYSLPVNVAGDPDDGEGSGLKCDLKANATTLKVPGSVMLTWTGGGNNRVQLISSTQAEKENADAEKKKEEEAKAKGEKYEQPKQNQPLTGGTIGDYLQPSGFMRVNVDKQTTFVLNAYDASNNVICTKSVEVKYEGGNDKKDIKLRITKIADENGVSQSVYGKGQMVSYTVALTDFVKGTDPTGAIAITDGTSTCSVNWPVNTCSFQAKKTGELTITAVYAGDDNYKKVTATAKEVVIDKMPTSIQINSAVKPAGDKADVEVELLWDAKHSYGMVPGGTVTLTAGSTSCDVDMGTETMTCAGDVTVKTVKDDGSISISVKNMGLKDATPDRVTAAYKGDSYFMPSTSQSVLFRKVNTQISIVNNEEIFPYKPDENHADLETLFNWVVKTDDKGDPVWGRTAVNGRTPTGTISFILTDSKASDYGKCEYDLTGKKFSCEGSVTPGNDATNIRYAIKNMLLANPAADRVRAEYSGDSIFNASKSATVLFDMSDTLTEITQASKSPDGKVGLLVKINPEKENPFGLLPVGTIKFTSGSKTCTLETGDDPVKNPDKVKLTDCNGEAVYDAETKTYKITDMEMGDKAGDTISAVYSGDSYYKGSTSPTVSFGKVDTALVLDGESVRKDAGDPMFVNLSGVLSWKQSDLKEKNIPVTTKPTGTITFKFGTDLNDTKDVPNKDNVPIDICKLDLETMDFDCAGEDTDIKKITSSEQLELTLKKILLSKDNIGADRVKALYSGDTYFNPSESLVSLFKKLDPKLKIVRITDENGKEHQWYAPEQTVIVEYDIASGTTGKVKLSVDTATCEVDLPQKSCPMKLAKVTGVRTLQASYGGDANYYSGSAEKKFTISEPKELNIEIVKTMDKEGREQEKYAEEEEVTVEIRFTDYDEAEEPTGPVTITVDTTDTAICPSSHCTCTINNYPEEKSCKMIAPSLKYGVDDDGKVTGHVKAEYSGNTYYYKPASADPYPFGVIGKPVEFLIENITNQYNVSQDYYAYDHLNKISEDNKQKIKIWFSLSPVEASQHGEITAFIEKRNGDKVYCTPNPVTYASVQTCEIKVSDIFTGLTLDEMRMGAFTINARYHDTNNEYVDKDTDEEVIIEKMIEPMFILFPAYRLLPEENRKGEFEFYLSSNSDLPETYDVSLTVDKTKSNTPSNWTYQTINFSYGSGTYTCSFTSEPGKLKCYVSDPATLDDPTVTKDDDFYDIINAYLTDMDATVVTAKYDGNTYFYAAEDTGNFYTDIGGNTQIDLKDLLKLNNESGSFNPRTFFTAIFSYNQKVEGALPKGKMLLTLGTTTSECAFDLSGDLSEGKKFECGTLKQVGKRIEFIFENITVLNSTSSVKVKFVPSDTNYNESESLTETFTPESVPEVNIDKAQKNASYKADVEISVTGMGTLTNKYEVYPYLRLSSKAKSDDPDSQTCRLLLYPTPHFEEDSSCVAFPIKKDGDTYSLGNFQGIIEAEDKSFSAALINEYATNPFAEEEFPKDTKTYTYQKIATSLVVTDPLKYHNTHAFLSFDILYDDEAAEEYGVTPTGYLQLHTKSDDGADNRKCTICLSEDECDPGYAPFCEDYGEQSRYAHFVIDQSAGTAHWELQNVFVSEWRTLVSLDYSGDEVFEDSSTEYEPFTKETAVLTIKDAIKTSDSIYTTVTLTGISELTDKYIRDQYLRFISNDGNNKCDYSLIDETFTGGCTADSVTRNGNTFTVKNLKGILTDGDTDLSVHFPTSYLEESEYAKAKKAYGPYPTSMQVSDGLRVGKMVYLTAVLTYDETPRDSYGKEPTGTLTFTSESGGATKQCDFDLSAETFSCGSLSRTGNKVTFIVNGVRIGGLSDKSATVTYNGDSFYGKSENSGTTVEEDVNLTVNSALKTNKNNHGYMAFTIPELGPLTQKYGVYPLMRISSKASNTELSSCDIDRDSLQVVRGSCTLGAIQRKTQGSNNVIIIKDFSGIVKDESETLAAALVNEGTAFHMKGKTIGKFTTSISVDTSSLIRLGNLTGSAYTSSYDVFADVTLSYGPIDEINTYYGEDLVPTGGTQDFSLSTNLSKVSTAIGVDGCSVGEDRLCKTWTYQKSEGNINLIAKRFMLSGSQLNMVQYKGDDVFQGTNTTTSYTIKEITAAISYTADPVVSKVNGAKVQFKINNFEYLKKYEMVQYLRFWLSKEGSTDNYSVYISPYTLDSGILYGGTITRTGDNFTVTNWGKDYKNYYTQGPEGLFGSYNTMGVDLEFYYVQPHLELSTGGRKYTMTNSLSMSSPSAASVSMTFSLGGQ